MPSKSRVFDIQNYIETPEAQTEYLAAAFEDGDPTFIAAALGDIARTRGVTAFAKEIGISREAIYKGFRSGGNPTLETLSKAAKALGFRLALVKSEAV